MIEPPLPAVSRPSNSTTSRWPVSWIQRAASDSSLEQRLQHLLIIPWQCMLMPPIAAPWQARKLADDVRHDKEKGRSVAAPALLTLSARRGSLAS